MRSRPSQFGHITRFGFKNLSDSLRGAEAVSTLHVLVAASMEIIVSYGKESFLEKKLACTAFASFTEGARLPAKRLTPNLSFGP